MNKLPKRIKVKVTERIYEDFFEGSVDRVIADLQIHKELGWEGIVLEYDYENTCYYFYQYREENDKEYNARLKRLEKDKELKENQKQKRFKEYQKLHKEFGDLKADES
jgi:primosomal protein N''